MRWPGSSVCRTSGASVRAFAVQPRREPAADVAAAGDGREIVDRCERADAREALQHAERERRAADAAARETERARAALVHARMQRVQPFVGILGAGPVEGRRAVERK